MIKHQSELGNLHFFVNFAHKKALAEGLEGTELNHIELAVEESIVNIIDYSFPDKTGEIKMDFRIQDNSLCYIIIDNGIPFNPLEKEDPDFEIPAEERKIGGLGIFLIKHMMDDVFYERKDDENILTLIKIKKSG